MICRNRGDHGGHCVSELLETLRKLGASGGAAPAKQSTGAFERLGEFIESFGRCARRRLRLGGHRRALREDAIKVRAADTDATADADRWKSALIYPVPQGLRVELQVVGDFIDREVLIVPARTHAN